MRWVTKARVKYVLAGVGVLYIVLFAGYLVYAAVGRSAPSGPSELEAHPERQAEILAKQRADEMKERLKLSDDQTQRIAEIFQANQASGAPAQGDFRGRWRAVQEQIAQVLTPEQQEQARQLRGQFGGPGGFRGRMSPERMESLRQKMTPEQRERFDKHMQRFQQRRGQRDGRQGQGQGARPNR